MYSKGVKRNVYRRRTGALFGQFVFNNGTPVPPSTRVYLSVKNKGRVHVPPLPKHNYLKKPKNVPVLERVGLDVGRKDVYYNHLKKLFVYKNGKLVPQQALISSPYTIRLPTLRFFHNTT